MKRYESISSGVPARHLLLKSVGVDAGFESLDDGALWALHDDKISEYRKLLESSGLHSRKSVSLLDVKVELAYRMLKACRFCERQCGIDRRERPGACCADITSHVSSEFLHQGEEPELIPSHTIFFEGCSFKCVYCQNYEIATRISGPAASAEDLCRLIERRYRQGSRNVNFVGGDPTPHLHTILKTVNCIDVNLPTIWNSNMYMSTDAMRLLEGTMDVFLADFRYGNDEHAKKYSGIDDYWNVTTRNFLEANRQAELLVRQLVLPGHVECCTKPIVEWCAANMGKNVRFNLMFQYHPVYRAYAFPEINRVLTSKEVRRAIEIVEEAGLTNVV